MSLPPLEPAVAGPAFAPLSAPAITPGDAAGAPARSTTTCANCEAPLTGPFCSACGAPALDQRPLTIGRFARDLANELTNVDSLTLRTFRSLLLHPGELTRDYLAGKTRWYLSPLRLYLIVFAIFIAVMALLPDREEMYDRIGTMTTVKLANQRREVMAALAQSHATPSLRERAALDMDPVRAAEQSVRALRFVSESQWIQVLNAFTWAAVLALIFRARRRGYAEHLVFGVHPLTFDMLLLIANASLRSLLHLPPSTSFFDAVSVLQWLAIGSYFYFASRRLYGEPRRRAGTKAVLFVAGAQLGMMLISTAAFAYAGFEEASSGRHRGNAPAAQHPPAVQRAR
jgi:hypothetical protein